MKRLHYIFLFGFLLLSSGLAAQDEYVVHSDSNANATVIKDCSRFIKISIRKTQRLTKRVKKLNDAYFTAFDRVQEKLLTELCSVNEGSAEYLRKDAQFSLNRFNNISAREGALSPKAKYGVLSQRNKEIERVVKIKNEKTKEEADCECQGINDLKDAQMALNKELKRSEVIGEYINEREQFMTKSLGNLPEASNSLERLQKLNYYFRAQLKENLKVFGLNSNWESGFLNTLKAAAAPLTSTVKSETEIQQPDWPNLKLEDLLVDAPKETKDAISQLKSPIADCDNLQVPVSVPSEVSTKLVEVDSLQNKITDERDSLRNDSNSADTLRQKLEKKNWAPNPLKTKRFVDRLIYTNALQLDRKTNWFPSCGTITGGIGYQVSKKSSVGIGLHYSIALDNVEEKKGEIALNKRKLLSNGYGGRAFADLLLLKSIYLQGSYELSQRAYAYDIQISELVPHHSLQPSCLVGLKLKYPARKNQNPTFEILYDVLHSQTGQPAIIMRTGIELKSRNSYR